jgi:hypothetical protein
LKSYFFENENRFQIEDGASRIDQSDGKAITIRCPHCLNIGTFQTASNGLRWFKVSKNSRVHDLHSFMRICPSPECSGVVLTVTTGTDCLEILPPELLDFDGSDLPPKLLRTLKEAIACHSVGAHRAAVMMVRRLLEEICEESDASGRTLHDRLIALKSKITFPEELFEAMGELKALGNDAAHITAKEYLVIGEDEAKDSIELVKEILKARYQLKGLVERLRLRKASNISSE